MTTSGYCECGCGQLTLISTKNDASTQRVKGRPMRFIRGHNALKSPPELLEGVTYIAKDCGYITPCWMWQGPIAHGYGIVHYQRREVRAHKYSHEVLVGSLPDNVVGHHKCRTKSCIRIDHVVWKTQSEHMRDHMLEDPIWPEIRKKAWKARALVTKLTEEGKAEIRELYSSGSYTQTQLGDMFGVSQGYISLLVKKSAA